LVISHQLTSEKPVFDTYALAVSCSWQQCWASPSMLAASWIRALLFVTELQSSG